MNTSLGKGLFLTIHENGLLYYIQILVYLDKYFEGKLSLPVFYKENNEIKPSNKTFRNFIGSIYTANLICANILEVQRKKKRKDNRWRKKNIYGIDAYIYNFEYKVSEYDLPNCYGIIYCSKIEKNLFYYKSEIPRFLDNILIHIGGSDFILVNKSNMEYFNILNGYIRIENKDYNVYRISGIQNIIPILGNKYSVYKYTSLPQSIGVYKSDAEQKIIPIETKKTDMIESSKSKKTTIWSNAITDSSSNQPVRIIVPEKKAEAVKSNPVQKTIASSIQTNEEMNKIHTEIEEKKAELKELSEQIETKNKDLKIISNEYSKYLVEKTAIQSEIEKKQTELKTLSDSQSDLLRQIEIKKQELEQLPEQCKQLAEKKAEIQAEVEKEQKNFEEQSEQHRKYAEELSKKCDELRREKEETEKEISEIATKITDTIARNSKIMPIVKAFFEGVSGRKAVISLYRQGNSVIANNSVISQLQHFVKNLSENLNEFIGYSSEDSLRLSQILSFAIGNRIPVLLPANEDLVAECAAAMFNRPIKIINADIDVPASAYNEPLNNLEPSVLLVNGAFDSLSAQYFNSLRYFSNKHILFFSVAGLEPALMPKAVFDKAIYVETNLKTAITNKKHPYFYKTDFSIFEQGNLNTDKQSDKLQNFAKCGIITYSVATYLARYLHYTNNQEIKNDIMLLNHLAICASAAHRQKEFKEIIPEYRNYPALLMKLQ